MKYYIVYAEADSTDPLVVEYSGIVHDSYQSACSEWEIAMNEFRIIFAEILECDENGKVLC